MFNPSAAAAIERAIERIGVSIQIQRTWGEPPSAYTFTVTVDAIVQNVQPDGTAEGQAGLASSQMGAISQNDRLIILTAHSLWQSRFPLPVQKGDWIFLPLTSENFSVTKVDPYKREMAGAIELTATGVQ
jgi:hypothetical protein